jgi:hypothetical protein
MSKMKLNALLFCTVILEALLFLAGIKTPSVNYGTFPHLNKLETAYQVNGALEYFQDSSYSDLHLRNRENTAVLGWHSKNISEDSNLNNESISITPNPSPTIKPNNIRLVSSHKEISAPDNYDVLIKKYASMYSVDAGLLVRIAKCESGFNPQAVNGPFAGMYQFMSGTWISNRKAMGLNTDPALRYDAEESIKTAAYKISHDGAGAWPVCSKV